MIVEPLRPLNR